MSRDERGAVDAHGIPFATLARTHGTPLYVYDAERIRQDYLGLSTALRVYPRHRIYYSLKANPNLAIAALLRHLGASVDVASVGEALLAQRAGFEDARISFTACCLTDEDLGWIARREIDLVLDSAEQGVRYARFGPRRTTVGLRVNPGILVNQFDPCLGSGPESKFGVPLTELESTIDALAAVGLSVQGLHFHIGTGSLTPEHHFEALRTLLREMPLGFAPSFIDIGGGIGIPYAPWLEPLDLTRFAVGVSVLLRSAPGNETGDWELRIEPGEFLVARAGWLLARVWAIKSVSDGRPDEPGERVFAITDAGSHLLPGASQFGTWYPIAVDGKDGDPTSIYDVVGPLNQTGDRLARARTLPTVDPGDLIVISMAGAYAAARATRFNGRPLPAEVLVLDSVPHLVREAEPPDVLWRAQHVPLRLRGGTS